MSHTRKRVAWFNVPASQQPLRVRAEDIRKDHRNGNGTRAEHDNPLEQLVIGHLFHPLTADGMHDQDPLEALDATYEDANGRLPHEPGYDPTAPVDPGTFEPEPEILVVEPIPDWVLADARDMAAGGMTLTRIAKAVLPATGCPDIPSCKEVLERRLSELAE